MNEPEYLSLFSNDGPGRVKVRFVGHPGKIAEQAFAPREVLALIDSNSQRFHRLMRFDDYLFEVHKYEIDPRTQTLTIVAGEVVGGKG